MRAHVVTLFPEAFEGFLRTSFVARAIAGEKLEVRFHTPRDFGLGAHKSVDDTPYGGGSGMVMRVDVMVACLEAIDAAGIGASTGGTRMHRVMMTPQGRQFDQAKAEELATRDEFVLICGRYEGFDERIRAHVDEEISLGDFVMTGGEVAAMSIIDATVRLLPGVLGNEESTREESHSPETGLLEYPQYTRPAEFRGEKVPEVLAGGNHAEIAAWRHEQAIEKTRVRRRDLYERFVAKEALTLMTAPQKKKKKK
ncbi:MAG: tRNA (guanosine(37)-N1)-methyltransferase TrmD [Polyangiaceae bacterium]